MRQYFDTNYLSEEDKENILSKHKTVYDGYKVMDSKVSNTQPLYVQDFRGDKEGMIMNNKGEIKKNQNFGINESMNPKGDEFKDEEMTNDFRDKKMRDEFEDEEMVPKPEEKPKNFMNRFSGVDLGKSFNKFKKMGLDETKEVCSECGSKMYEGECMECGNGGMYEETGHLDDIYDEEDLNPNAEFDYVHGSSNKDNTFKSMHKDMYEQGGNADDMDVSDVEPAYDFVSGGPDNGGDAYPVNEEDDYEYEPMESAWADDMEEQDLSGVQGIYSGMEPAYDFVSGGAGKAGPYQRRFEGTEKELDELSPEDLIKGKKYKYSSPSFEDEIEFDSEHEYPAGDKMYGFKGGKMGHSMSGKHIEDFVSDIDMDDLEDYGEKETAFDRIRKNRADVEDAEWEEVDDDIKESFLNQKNKINEMFNRMNRYN